MKHQTSTLSKLQHFRAGEFKI